MPDGPSRIGALALVAVGGFAGTVLRHAVATGLPGAFPWGTLAANAVGSFLLGVLLYEARLGGVPGPEARLLLGTGFCGAFTTFSTFAAETAGLPPTLAVANVAANYTAGFGAVLLGRLVVGWLP